MKKTIALYLIGSLLLIGCQPKRVEPLQIGIRWKPALVKENGAIVYREGATGNQRPGYTNFRLDLTNPGEVLFIDVDGRRITGTWSLSTDNARLILQNLSPPPSESSGNIEFYVTATPTSTTLNLKRTNESRKTGNSVNEYELIPE
jgi:hypothetical protein